MTFRADPIARIELADKLLDHYQGVISRAREAARRRDGAELDLQIADAARVYPLIWEALDDAARGLAAKGRDLSLYVRLRSDRSDESAAVRDDGLPRRISAKIRHRGVMLAEEASEALKRVTPERDWHDLGDSEPSRGGWLSFLTRWSRGDDRADASG